MRLSDNFQVGRCRVAGHKLQHHGRRCRGGAVLTQQHQPFPDAAQVEVGVPERVQVTRTPQALPGGNSPRRVLAGVMHENDGQIKSPLQKPEVSQQLGHLPGVILVDGMQPDQRIEQQQPRPQPLGGLQKPISVWLAIQSVAAGDSDVSGPETQPAPALESLGDETGEGKELPGGYSPDEIIALKDFASLSEEEIERARQLLQDFVSAFASLRSRRRTSSRRGRLLDFRRMLRRTATQGLDATELVYRRRKIRKLRLLLLCDVSGSMERYARFLLEFIFALRRALPKTEVAVFSTRMTVITDLLQTGTVSESLRQVARRAGDWGGGTDIGGCLRDFNDLYARQLLHTDSVVLILSDGWDRGDARLMSAEFEHLRQRAHRIVWLNPLLGNPKYEPLTRGMRTALPHLDYFLPAHNLESFSRLSRTFQAIWH